MASQFLLVIIFSALLMISFSSAIKHETLNIICSQTQNEETCLKILESDSGTVYATLPQLSLISINLTRYQATSNLRNFGELKVNATASPLKGSYDNCLKIYRLIFGKINEAYGLSKKGLYKEIAQLGEAQDLAYRCENGLPSNSSTTADVSETMILTCETSASVNLYVANNVVPPSV